MSKRSPQTRSEIVAAYLLEHPDFYQSHPEVLETLELSHGISGSASLLEKQITLLRNKNEEISDRLFQLIEIARAHEKLSLSLHKIAVNLVGHFGSERTDISRLQKARLIESNCRRILHQYLTDIQTVIHWSADFIEGSAGDISVINMQDQRIRGLVNRLYANKKPECGPFSKPERIVLFPKFVAQTMSAIVAPLSQPDTDVRMGLLVLASNDSARYVAGKGTMFLVQLMQLIESALTPENSVDNNDDIV